MQCQSGRPGARPDSAGLRENLPPDLAAALSEFVRHLRLECNRSPRTIAAYQTDITLLLTELAERGIRSLDRLSLPDLRSWLAGLHRSGMARATLARRSAAVRTFTAWAANSGLIGSDVGELLAGPKQHQAIPAILSQEQAAGVIDEIVGDDPTQLRDRVLLELL